MDKVELSSDVSTINTVKLSLANNVDSFVSSESSLSAQKVLEVLADFDSPSDKSVILLHYVLKVLHGAMLAALWQFNRLFQFCDRFDIEVVSQKHREVMTANKEEFMHKKKVAGVLTNYLGKASLTSNLLL